MWAIVVNDQIWEEDRGSFWLVTKKESCGCRDVSLKFGSWGWGWGCRYLVTKLGRAKAEYRWIVAELSDIGGHPVSMFWGKKGIGMGKVSQMSDTSSVNCDCREKVFLLHSPERDTLQDRKKSWGWRSELCWALSSLSDAYCSDSQKPTLSFPRYQTQMLIHCKKELYWRGRIWPAVTSSLAIGCHNF